MRLKPSFLLFCLLLAPGLSFAEDKTVYGLNEYVRLFDLDLKLAAKLDIPLITGKMPNKERDVLYDKFRKGTIHHLMVSKVGNFAIDLPDASILIQISGTFGSRQEEAQRLGRVLRPKEDGRQAHFYTLVTQDSREQEFAMNRQLFLTEQGYAYKILKAPGGHIESIG